MKIRELFVADVTRDIPPVVYFHEQTPDKLRAEVEEYIITGGHPESDPRGRRVRSGIHEQLVHLLQNIRREQDKRGGPELPAAWISGFYGSGKSSFAKLLGLALDGKLLPDGTPLSTALLARNDSPRRAELVEAWTAVAEHLKPFAVVFDIGGVARDDEHIHSAVLRVLQVRLGYCSKSSLVADFELRLERDGEYPTFLETARRVLGKEWAVAKEEEQAEDHFSHVLSVMKPGRYTERMSWIESRAGARTGAGTSVREVVEAIDAMIHIRMEEQALFVVVDEVSQYVHQDENRMLKLQSFISELGQRLKGRVWLLATGQQKLDDDARNSQLAKLKDRFPTSLRVHLDTTNIRDVVHKRLLRKRPEHDQALRAEFRKHRGDLKLHGYGCEDLSEEDFVEIYPMLPGHIDLLMQITSSLRTRSQRAQGDAHAIRGLLQLLGDVFREQRLADEEVGALVTLDAIFAVLFTSLDADIQTTLHRIFADPHVASDAIAQRAARAVALLELIQEHTPTTPELVAQCLHARLGAGSGVAAVATALDKLRGLGLLSYSEKSGFKIQSSAGQEWQRERDDLGPTPEQISKSFQEALRTLVGSQQERATWKGRKFPWALYFSDGRYAQDARLQDPREESTVTVDFRFLGKKDDRESSLWVPRSDEPQARNRLLWVAGHTREVEDVARELGKSQRMIERNRSRRESLSPTKQVLLVEEEARAESLEGTLRDAVAKALHEGTAYFRGQTLRPRDSGAFGPALVAMASRILPDLYPSFSEIAIVPSELAQLLDRELKDGPSEKFMEGRLGILSVDAGKYVASCAGAIPRRIAEEIGEGMSGQQLVATFVGPPYGHPPDLVKACLAGLLRAKKIRIRPEEGGDITSYQDPGVRDLFALDRKFRRADFFSANESEISARDRVAIRKLFRDLVGVDVHPDDELIADATFDHFPRHRERLRSVESRLHELPGRPGLPDTLARLVKALEDASRSRQVLPTVVAVKRNLDALRDGLTELGILEGDLTPEAIALVSRANRLRDHELEQLRAMEQLGGLEEEAAGVAAQLDVARPWRDVARIGPALERIRASYVEIRGHLLNRQALEVEQARARVKTRPGFEQLDADEAHRVLRPFAEVLVETSDEAVAPTLVELRDRFAGRLERALARADDQLDEELARKTEKQVVKVEASLRGREIASRPELEALKDELEARLGPLVGQGHRVRIV